MKKQAGLNPIPGPKATGHKKAGPTRTAQSGFNPLPPGGGGGAKRGPGAASGMNPLPVRRQGGGQTLGRAAPVHPHKPKRPKRKKPVRKLSPGDVACCSAQAVGTLLGWDWEQVLGLYWRTAGDPDAGASIEDTLDALGLTGVGACRRLVLKPHAPALIRNLGYCPSLESGFSPAATCGGLPSDLPLILGADLPGSHALAVTPDGTWWSWGEPFDPAAWPDMIIDEAWAVLL